MFLFSTILLTSSFISQIAYSHPTNESWNKSCERYLVTAEISEIEVMWYGNGYGDTSGFNDALDGNAEVEILYKIWEPFHENPEWYDKKYGEPVVSRLYISDMIGKNNTVSKEYQSFNGTMKKFDQKVLIAKLTDIPEHQKYMHIQCADELGQLGFSVIASERDSIFWFSPDDMDELLGGNSIEEELQKVVNKKKEDSKYSVAIELQNTIGNKFGYAIKGGFDPDNFEQTISQASYGILGEVIEDQTLWKPIYLAEEIAMITTSYNQHALRAEISAVVLEKFAIKEAVEGGIKRVAGTWFAEKIGQFAVGGPIGWLLFIGTTAYDVYQFVQWVGGGDDYLGGGSWTIDLSQAKNKPPKEPLKPEFVTNAPTVAVKYAVETVLPPELLAKDREILEKDGVDYDKVLESMNPEGASPDTVYYRSIGPTQEGTVKITFEVNVEPVPPKCSTIEDVKKNTSFTPKQKNFVNESGTIHQTTFSENKNQFQYHLVDESQYSIPEWIKTNAHWWSNGLISDSEFAKGIEFLIENKVIRSDSIEIVASSVTESPFTPEFKLSSKELLSSEKPTPLTISGSVPEIKRATPIEIIIEKPDGTNYATGVFPDSSGSFSHTWNVEKNSPFGTYNAIAKYDGIVIGEETFSFTDSIMEKKSDVSIPTWIKNNARWWSEGLIADSDFSNGIEYLIEDKIITSPKIKVVKNDESIITDPSEVPIPLSVKLEIVDDEIFPDEYVRLLSHVAGTGPFQFQWFVENKKADSDNIILDHRFDSPGLFDVKVVVTDKGGNSKTETITVLVKDSTREDDISTVPESNTILVEGEGDPTEPPEIEIIDHDKKMVHVAEAFQSQNSANWKLVDYKGQPLSGLTPYFLVDDGDVLVKSKSKTDSEGYVSFKFDSSYSPGSHHVGIYTFDESDDVLYFDNCDMIEVNVIESTCSDKEIISATGSSNRNAPSTVYAIDKKITYHTVEESSLSKSHKLNPNQVNSISVSWKLITADGSSPKGTATAFVDSVIDQPDLQYLGTGNRVYVEGDRSISTPIIDGVATFTLKDTFGAYGPSKNVDYYFENFNFDAVIELESVDTVSPHYKYSLTNEDPFGVICVEKIPDRVITASVKKEIYDEPIFVNRGSFGSYTAYGKLIYSFTYPDGTDAPVSFKLLYDGDKEWPSHYFNQNTVTLRCSDVTSFTFELADVKPVYDGYYDGNKLPITSNISCP